jgi:hypothetical protein
VQVGSGKTRLDGRGAASDPQTERIASCYRTVASP